MGYRSAYDSMGLSEELKAILGEKPKEPEKTVSGNAAVEFCSIVRRIEELEACDRILCEILATLAIQRNRDLAAQNPAYFSEQILLLGDAWRKRRDAVRPLEDSQ
jgi:hypothetical protein